MNSKQLGTVQWGIIGCGDVTEVKSGPALQKIGRSRLVSVMRRNGDKAADYAARHNVPKSTDDANALINDPEVTAVYVATPPNSHADYAIRALHAGKDVLLEKPIAPTIAECDAIEEAIRETNGKLCIAYYRRALPRFEKMREIAQGDLIGDVHLVEVRQFKRPNDVSAQSWKTDPKIGGGGSFVDMQTHTLDWLGYLYGHPKQIKGQKKQLLDLHAAEDFVSFLADFGAVTVSGLFNYSASFDEEYVLLHGTKGTAKMGFFCASDIKLVIDETVQTINLPDPAHVHQPFIEKVVGHFLDDTPNPCSAKSGRLSTELVERIFKGL